MGLLDAILGKTELPQAKTERLFAISTAAVTMEASLGLKADGAAAICFKPMESSKYDRAYRDIEGLLKISTKDSGTKYSLAKDEYNYLWAVLEDPDFEDLVALIHMVSQTLIEQGFGTQLLCAVYRFRGEKAVYWIYSFKRGTFYPLVPSGDKQRDNAMEIRLKAVMEKEMPVEKDLGLWYPLWGMPI